MNTTRPLTESSPKALRDALGRVALGALLFLLVWPGLERLSGPADLGPVMPEMDGVHPARALSALRTAYTPGAGFLDKYPPLGSYVMGVVCALVDDDHPTADEWLALPASERRVAQWDVASRTLSLLRAERWVSRVAMAVAAGLAMLLAARLSLRFDVSPLLARRLAPALALLTFGTCYPVAYYGATANVDALALCASLAALLAGVERRWTEAAVAAACATAFKDPAFVLGPVLVLGALADGTHGGWRAALRVTLVGGAAYALLAGAALTPSSFVAHVEYLVSGGVDAVDRIDRSDVGAWIGLLGYGARLLLGALGVATCVLGVAGWVALVRRDRLAGWLLVGVVLATAFLFVLPAGFVYVRFLLVPLALSCVGTAVIGVLLVDAVLRRGARSAEARLRAAALFVLVLVGADWAYTRLLGEHPWGRAPFAPLEDLRTALVQRADPRREAADAVDRLFPGGARVVLVADGREAGPPIDPRRHDLAVVGLDEAPGLVARWTDDPASRPDALLWMTFPTESPAGRPYERPVPMRPGAAHFGLRVDAVFGAPTGTVAERTLALRPTVTLLLRP